MSHTYSQFKIKTMQTKNDTENICPNCGYELKKNDYISNEMQRIADVISDATGITVEAIKSKSRKREVVIARHFFFYFARKFFILREIGEFSNNNHATVLFGKNKVKSEMSYDKRLQLMHDKIKNKL